jgi:hypothetical protein
LFVDCLLDERRGIIDDLLPELEAQLQSLVHPAISVLFDASSVTCGSMYVNAAISYAGLSDAALDLLLVGTVLRFSSTGDVAFSLVSNEAVTADATTAPTGGTASSTNILMAATTNSTTVAAAAAVAHGWFEGPSAIIVWVAIGLAVLVIVLVIVVVAVFCYRCKQRDKGSKRKLRYQTNGQHVSDVEMTPTSRGRSRERPMTSVDFTDTAVGAGPPPTGQGEEPEWLAESRPRRRPKTGSKHHPSREAQPLKTAPSSAGPPALPPLTKPKPPAIDAAAGEAYLDFYHENAKRLEEYFLSIDKPKFVAKIPKILLRNRGNEAKLFRMLVHKYGGRLQVSEREEHVPSRRRDVADTSEESV